MTPANQLGYPRSGPDAPMALPAGPEPQQQRSDEIDLRALLGTLLDHKRLIIAVTVIFALLGIAYVLIATPVYRATAMVQVEQAPSLPGMTAFEQAMGARNPAATDALSILTSHSVVKKAVDALNLNIRVSPYRVPLLGDLVARHFTPSASGDVANPWLGLSGYGWGGAKLKVSRLDVPRDLYGKKLTLVAGKNGAYVLLEDGSLPFSGGRRLLQGQVGKLAQGSGVSMLVTGMQANPGMHFHVVRDYEMTTVSRLQNSIQAKQTAPEANVIKLSLESSSPATAVAILDHITEAYLAQNVGRNSAQAANSLKFVKQQMPVVKKKLTAAQAALNKYQVKAHSVNVPMQTQSMLTRIDNIDASLQKLKIEKVKDARLYTPAHPAYKAVTKQIAQLRGEKSRIQKQMGKMPDTQRQLLRLKGNVNVLNTTYTGLLKEAQQLQIAQAGTVGTTRIVDAPAVDITRPVKPKKATTVVGCAVVGAFLSMAFVLLRHLFRRGVEDPADIEQLGLPVYTAIPLSEQQLSISENNPRLFGRQQQRLLALAAPADLAAEALRGLRTCLCFIRADAADNRLMICGSSPKAGKTFISANLAALSAQAGQRVLLIDANMRDGKLHTVLGSRAAAGLSELLAGKIEVDEAIRQVDDIENLDFIASGDKPSDPSELLMRPRFGALLRQLSPKYDLVVIDSPPILSVTDAAIIGRHVGTSLLVVRFGLNQAREVELAMQRFGQSGVAIKGVVFNGVEKRNGGYSVYGYEPGFAS